MTNDLLEKNKNSKSFAVISIDWSKGSRPPYAQSVANIRFVGSVTGRLLHLLVYRKGLDPARVHLVGHSLGAHLFGYAGAYLQSAMQGAKVGRITGLDPAGPYFRDGPPEIRLDETDAELVVAIHTDSTSLIPTFPESLGIAQAIGHVDFFPDGGGEQSACQESSEEETLWFKQTSRSLVKFVACSHIKSYQYFTASVNQRCSFIGIECPSWSDFNQGLCWDCTKRPCYKMGYTMERFYPTGYSHKKIKTDVIIPPKNRTKLYLATSSKHLCGNQVRLSIIPFESHPASNNQFVRVSLTLRGDEATAKTSPDEKVFELGPGLPKTWVDAVRDIGTIHSIIFNLVVEEGFIQSLFWSQSTQPIHLKEVIYEELSTGRRIVFPFCEKSIVSEEVVILKNKSCISKLYRRRAKG